MKHFVLILVLAIAGHAAAQDNKKSTAQKDSLMKMKVEIWSDVMCPFCYIGKRNFEKALEQFPHKDRVEIEWRSFQLDPEMKDQPDKNVYTYLAERKGQSLEWSKQAHKQVSDMASEAGLTYNFDKAVIANSFNAHRLIQLAKKHKLGDAAEERLFRSYFTEGGHIGNIDTLVKLGTEIGLDPEEVKATLQSNAFAEEVLKDVNEAQMLGARGVPFFVLDRSYGISGAQAPATMLGTLQKAWEAFEQKHPTLINLQGDGPSCDPEGNCE